MSEPARLRRRHWLWLLAVTFAVLLLLSWLKPEPERTLRSLPPTQVSVETVARSDLQPLVLVTGQLQAARSARLHLEVAGRVVSREVEPGDAVDAGQTLLTLDGGELADAVTIARAQLEQEQAAIARDRRLLALAREGRQLQGAEVGRIESLGSQSLASVSQLGEARQRLAQLSAEEARLRYAVDTAEARLALREAELSRAERRLAQSRLSAPFAGVVNSVAVVPGDYVTANQAVLELLDLHALDFYVEVNGQVAAALQRGQTVLLEGADGEPRDGTIVAVQRSPDASTHTYALRIRVAAEGLQPGQLAVARLPLAERQGVFTVPTTAVLQEDGESYLFVYREGRLERRAVEPGLREAGRVVIRGGLAEGEQVVARDIAALVDGQAVVLRATTTELPTPPELSTDTVSE